MTEVMKEFIQKNEGEKIIEIEIERLRSFKNHPFQVKDDKEMYLLKESIEKYGILNPLIVRPVPDGVYEIISGHRRKHAAELLGYRKVPVLIRVMTEDESILNMVDKLKLNGGDIKAVQGDSGHSQVDMVTDVYSHIIDEDRRRNAELFEEAFYEKKNLDPKMREETASQTVDVPDDVDAELLAKVLANPEMKALLVSLAKAMK